ncbi:MAG: YfcC family protein [Sphaerochaetaceae bacterium]|nr:YfcC family protein [Sphaerochaetaceae bacterium]
MKDKKTKWYMKMPHTLVILFIMIVFAAILTWIIPAGQFDMVKVGTRSVIDPNTFHLVDKNPASLFDVFRAIPAGLQGASQIIFMILLSSGCFAVMNSTGAIDSFIGVSLKKIKKSKVNPLLVVFLVTVLFSSMGIVIGPEIIIPFTSISVSIALGLGFDTLVGLAMVVVGGFVGFCMGPVCASTIGTADAICGLPLFSGVGLRSIIWAVTTASSALIVVSYGRKVKANPDYSYVKGIDISDLELGDLDSYNLEKKDKLVLLCFLLMFIAMIIGPIFFGWYLDELMAVFVIASIIVAIITGMSSTALVETFTKGAGAMFGVAMLVGMGRSIQVILSDSNVMHTIIYYLSKPISNFGPFAASVLMSIVHTLINFLIPSGSGQAAATMPIMFPLGEAVGISNQVNILAFQIGDGFSNMIYPTMGALMAMCGIAKVPYEKWIKLGIKVVLTLTLITWVFLFIAIKINWGPF